MLIEEDEKRTPPSEKTNLLRQLHLLPINSDRFSFRSQIQMDYKSAGTSSLLKLVEERALLKKIDEVKKEKDKVRVIPHVPKECIYNILLRLPLESLWRSRFVGKPWHDIVSSTVFVNQHLHCSEAVLLFLTPYMKDEFRPYLTLKPIAPQKSSISFSVEEKLLDMAAVPFFERPDVGVMSNFSIQFLEIKGDKGELRSYNARCTGGILAASNGLVLMVNKLNKGGVFIMNPVTRKIISLPIGTIYPSHDESYALVLSQSTSNYKVVHLFRDESGYIGCEILNIGAKSWRPVNGPPYGQLGWFGDKPVSAIGALHWIPLIDRSDYLVSLGVEDEKFQTIMLPKSCRTHDSIVEMWGMLCFLTHNEKWQIDIWGLKNMDAKIWTLQHTIRHGYIMDMVALCSLRTKDELVLRRNEDGSLYVYDFQTQLMRKVQVERGGKARPEFGSYLPHVNSLVSW